MQSNFFATYYLLGTGHAPLLQFSDCEAEPTQSFPFSDGGGDVHDRCLVLDPCPQVRLHDAQLPQTDHFPST